MPGKQVKNWEMYHALRKKKGKKKLSKESAARITNWMMSKARRKKKK